MNGVAQSFRICYDAMVRDSDMIKPMNIRDIFAQNGLVIQQESFTCGPCTLLNVLRLKGIQAYTEAELAKLCGAKPGVGISCDNMVKVAQQIGLNVTEQKENANILDIQRHLESGACVIVNYIDQYSGHGHYAVITEQDARAFYLRDCTSGFFRFEKAFFVKFWRGDDGMQQWFMAIA